jgi:hypothetical protein
MPLMKNIVRFRTGRGTVMSKTLKEGTVGPFSSQAEQIAFCDSLSEKARPHTHIAYFISKSREDAWVHDHETVIAPEEFDFEKHFFVPARKSKSSTKKV